jgi:hypothetical protein
MSETAHERQELLAEYTTLMNRHGADSVEAARFLEEHRKNPEFVELAEVCWKLKKAFVRRVAEQC